MQTLWDQRYAQRAQRMASSIIRELLKLTEQPDLISFAGGLPAPEVFPVEELAAAAQRVLREFGAQALQYSTTEGYRPLRQAIAERMAGDGLGLSLDNVLITSGSQQALDLLGRLFIDPGDRIVVESPTYLGALQAWNAYGAEYVTVPSDEQGMVTEALEEALRTEPKFVYVVAQLPEPNRRDPGVGAAETVGKPGQPLRRAHRGG